ncbi:hypothetical protein [Paenarthrobacter nitroguajacolicus]|uniref:hypothetical protein n=1 Tax=Paenarthrobacter nitroguajacolicus TaxID=211146 RepID=UPI00248B8645|nr:hypothetical protein [Paenarthrobacter nitroguajacolicus]MDI2036935.1 hypothetical protein [Paenarthrobacter nitroguajacolicus]
MGTTEKNAHALRVTASLLGLVGIAAYAVTAALQILVWNPLAAVPGATLEEIHEGLARSNESISIAAVVTWWSIGTLLAAVVVLLTATRVIARMGIVVILDLLILALGAPIYFFTSFSAGMALADAFFISGGDYAPWGGLLCLMSAAALAAAVLVTIFRKRPAPAPA